MVWLMTSSLSSWLAGQLYPARSLPALSGALARLAKPLVDRRDAERVVPRRIALARVAQELGRLLGVAAEHGDLGKPGDACSRSSARAASRRAPRAPRCSAASASSRLPARDREVGGPPERAREAPAVAGPPEDVASLGEVALGARRSRRRSSRRGRARRGRARARAGRPARPAARAPARGARALRRGRPRRARGRRGGRAPWRCPASSPAASNRASLSSSSARARARSPRTRAIAGLVRQRVADRRVAGDLDERLQRVLEHDAAARSRRRAGSSGSPRC